MNYVNYFTPRNIYLDTVYKLQYPTVDNIKDTLFVYLLLYVKFNSQGHIATGSLQVEETSAYCTVNHRALASNYQLFNMKRSARDLNLRPQRLEARTLTTPPPSPLTDTLRKLGRGAVLYKIDLSRAFCQLRIDPHDFNLLCLKWEGKYYIDLYCPFGHKSGSMSMSRLTQLFTYIMREKGYTICSYVDDMIGCSLRGKADSECNFLLSFLKDLGFPISPAKLVRPTHSCNCLGSGMATQESCIESG